MSTIDPNDSTDFSALDALDTTVPAGAEGWTCHVGDGLTATDFTPQVMARSVADYEAAADREGWANHYDGLAESWVNGGYPDKAADYQKYADAERQKADESLGK
jgi:hypothetical protein